MLGLKDIDDELYERFRNGSDESAMCGCTVALCLVDLTGGSVLVANLGDSPVIMGRKEGDGYRVVSIYIYIFSLEGWDGVRWLGLYSRELRRDGLIDISYTSTRYRNAFPTHTNPPTPTSATAFSPPVANSTILRASLDSAPSI